MNDNWSIRGDPQVTMTPSLYKENDKNYYYVVHLKEDIHHFFLGFFGKMAAPVVAVAKLEKSPIRTIIYDANGGKFTKGGVDTTDQPKDEVLIGSGTTIRLPSLYEMYHTGFDFKNVWCTTPDGSGTCYYSPKHLTSEEVDALFGDKDTVTLYALWVNQTPEVIEGLSIYAAMKGNKKNGKDRTGLEELMTFRTWKSIDKTVPYVTVTTTNADGTTSTTNKSDADNTVSFAAVGSDNKRNTYNATLGIYEEKVNIIPRSNSYDYTAFFDLSTDFTYYDNHGGTKITYPEDNYNKEHSRSNWGGLFKYTLLEKDYRVADDDFNLFRIIKAKANGYDPEGTPGCPKGYNGVGCLDGENKSGSGNYTFGFFGKNGASYSIVEENFNEILKNIRFRSHTSFNINSGWNVRSGDGVAISSKYVTYVETYLKKFLQELQALKGSTTTLAEMNITDEEIKEIIKNKKFPPVYFSYIKATIENNPDSTLTNTEIDSIVAGSNPAQLTSNEDPLYVRIESEELNEGNNDRYGTLVRQIWLNVEKNYTAEGSRPMVIFYEGPDRGLSEAYDKEELETGQAPNPSERYPFLTKRDSEPVILNLNADFKGILFAPNSPVAIIGNGHKLEGFVIAQKFVKPLTSPEGEYTNEKTINGVKVYTNEWGDIGYEDLELGSSATRRTQGSEIPYNMGKDEGDYKDINDYINTDLYKDYANELTSAEFDVYKNNLKNYEYVFKASAFNLSSDSHYDNFGIPELTREVYWSLNENKSEDMFFTTIRSKWIT